MRLRSFELRGSCAIFGHPGMRYIPRLGADKIEMNTSTWRRIFRGWLIVGVVGCGFILVMAIAHYGFGEPVYDKNTGHLASESQVAWIDALLGVGFSLFAVLGAVGLRKFKR